MPVPTPAHPFTLFGALHRASPVRPLQLLLRTAQEKLRPAQPRVHVPAVRTAQDELLSRAAAGPHQLSTWVHEKGRGHTPTIVLGGFVPESTEQIFLLRRFFLRSGDLYCLNYARLGFSLDLLCAQLDDLVAELRQRGERPVIFSVSFGCGLVMEWLRRSRVAGRDPLLAGVVIVSPVACTADIVAPHAVKPATLLGRALRPLLGPPGSVDETVAEKSREIFRRMFTAGAQNKASLQALMTATELGQLQTRVLAAIRGISAHGAHERVRALHSLPPVSDYFAPTHLPLTNAPTLVLFAEQENAVLDPASPTRLALHNALRDYFPEGRSQIVRSRVGPPVQHASLIFHVFDFLPPITAFYQRSKARKLKAAA